MSVSGDEVDAARQEYRRARDERNALARVVADIVARGFEVLPGTLEDYRAAVDRETVTLAAYDAAYAAWKVTV